jgi:hypothetical protein
MNKKQISYDRSRSGDDLGLLVYFQVQHWRSLIGRAFAAQAASRLCASQPLLG